MSTTATLPANFRRDAILQQVIARGTRVTVTERGESGWRMHTGTFLPETGGEGLIWVELGDEPREPGGVGGAGLAPGREIGLTFRRGHKKCICCCTVERCESGGGVTRIGLRRPRQVQELQRRVFERTEPTKDCPIEVELRALPGGTSTGGVIRGSLIDISAGGIRVRANLTGKIEVGAGYLCSLRSDAARMALTVEAVLRHAEAPVDGAASLGLQFIGLEASTQGYEKLLGLARFVKSLQRRTARTAEQEGGRTGVSAVKSGHDRIHIRPH
ncbi:MAG: PilZ domain-containing protein [Phycisphaerae bacterium]|nr:MAG: PilZ domain-containing protein [Planctomycetota bacterium]KAB2939550.1 MAG: PilZ domain-containing protein [Phycisphaerae bacterium]MBE7458632.1 PilZ domain-containing protein [Planctomycetia bacterium]MCK6465088.1 PilZ domain-containing protein [Phycisphaerae bacterium]MCL4718613.1 PilZ domain-containing protein [Phycisphaerae bacterium]